MKIARLRARHHLRCGSEVASIRFLHDELGRAAIGTWSGGRYLHFGEKIEEERLEALLRPGDGIETAATADAYGQGEADSWDSSAR